MVVHYKQGSVRTEVVMYYLRCGPDVFLKDLRKITSKASQNNWCHG